MRHGLCNIELEHREGLDTEGTNSVSSRSKQVQRVIEVMKNDEKF